jgi:hypothetical protein
MTKLRYGNMNSNNMTKTLLTLAGIIIAFIALTYAINIAELHECLVWQAQAKQYPLFYLTDWQADQCTAHNIEVLPNNNN